MGLATLASRLLGLVREQVMAGLFGASGLSDAFFVAYRIPNLLRGLFAEGAFSSAFVPSFIEVKQKYGDRGAREVLWKTFISLGALTFILSALVAFFSEEIVSLFVDELFTQDQEKFLLAVKLTEVMAPYLCLTSLAAVFMGALNSYKSYFTPAFAPAIFNLTVILAAWFLPHYLKGDYQTYRAISYGVVLGGVFQLVFQLPKLLKLKLSPVFSYSQWTGKFQSRIIRKMGPGVLGTAAQHLNLLVGTILATGSTVGAVSFLTYAFRLFQFPVGIIGVSIGNSYLVEFSNSIKLGKKEEGHKIFQRSQELSLLLLLPVSIIAFLGAEELVRLVFERGAFDKEATTQTAMALRYYILGLPLYGYYKNLNVSLYALERAKLPVIFSAISIGLSLLVSWALIDRVGFQVLAFGSSLVFLLNIIFLGLAMKRLENWGISTYFTPKILKFFLLSILIFFMTWKIVPYFLIKEGFWGSFFFLCQLSFFVFALFFLGVFFSGDLRILKKILRRK